MRVEAADLNLLIAFEALHAERQVTRAAQRLGRSQPAMSHALARLRQLFGDPLFVPTPAGLEPTEHARRLAPDISEALRHARTAIEGLLAFSPANAEKTFHLTVNDYVEAFAVPLLLAEIAVAAPALRLHLRRANHLFEVPEEDLASGKTDLALGFYPESYAPSSPISGRRLWDEQIVAVVRRRHPSARGKLSLQELLALEHVRVAYDGSPAPVPATIDRLLDRHATRRRVAVTLTHLRTVADIVAATDLVGFLPARFAHLPENAARLRTVAVTLALPNTPLVMVWHERTQHDPAHGWIRSAVERLSEAFGSQLGGTRRRTRRHERR